MGGITEISSDTIAKQGKKRNSSGMNKLDATVITYILWKL